MTRAEWTRLGGFSTGVVLLHVLGFGLFLYYLPRNPALTGLATLAYTFGLRHAFDADHIAAIDNTTRKLMQDGKRPLGTGFFFSLGHSTIVFSLTAGLAVAAGTVHSQIGSLQTYGSTIGVSVSGTFLLLIGALNLLVLLEVVGVFRRMRRGHYDEQDLERALANQGFLARFLLKRVGSRIDKSWKMYPLGVLFGLGFDTATEISLFTVAASQASGGMSFSTVMIFPALFTAGMTLVDTTDSVLMVGAYGWAFLNPIRKIWYNLTITAISVLVALLIGGIEALGLIAGKLGLEGRFWDTIGDINGGLANFGYLVVGIFVVSWALSYLIYRWQGFDRPAAEQA
jgi:nickel/cobalt transporter (NiCoT) family protein